MFFFSSFCFWCSNGYYYLSSQFYVALILITFNYRRYLLWRSSPVLGGGMLSRVVFVLPFIWLICTLVTCISYSITSNYIIYPTLSIFFEIYSRQEVVIYSVARKSWLLILAPWCSYFGFQCYRQPAIHQYILVLFLLTLMFMFLSYRYIVYVLIDFWNKSWILCFCWLLSGGSWLIFNC